jgi:hypothetical protein
MFDRNFEQEITEGTEMKDILFNPLQVEKMPERRAGRGRLKRFSFSVSSVASCKKP